MRPEIERAIELLQTHEPEALEQALALMQGTIFSFSMKVCGHREDAEDTTQEVLLKSIPYLPRLTSPKALAVWLYKVAKNRCLMSRRRSQFAPRQELSLEALLPDRKELGQLASTPERSPESAALNRERARHLHEAVRQLPPDYRIVLVLRDMEGLSDEEVGEITGLRPGTVRVRLHRARLFVRKRLAGEGRSRPAKSSLPVQAAHSPSQRCRQLFAALSDYLDQELDDAMCRELEAHLGDCPPCEAFLDTLQHTVQQCRLLPAAKPDARAAARVRKSILTSYTQEFPGRPRSR